jgi:hypothetical protein
MLRRHLLLCFAKATTTSFQFTHEETAIFDKNIRLLDKTEQKFRTVRTESRHKQAAELLRWTFHNLKRDPFILCAASCGFLQLVTRIRISEVKQALDDVKNANANKSASIASALKHFQDMVAAVEGRFPPEGEVSAPLVESSNARFRNLKPGMVCHSPIMHRLAGFEPNRLVSSTEGKC